MLKFLSENKSSFLIPFVLFILPLTYYYYAVTYETAYLHSFNINKEYAQINPLVLSETFYALIWAVFIYLVVTVIFMFLWGMLLSLRINLLNKKRFLKILDLLHKIESFVRKIPYIKQLSISLLIWLSFVTILPVLVTGVADWQANEYLQEHSCVTINNGEDELMLVRQYGDMLILREYDPVHNAVVTSSDFEVIRAENAYMLNAECHNEEQINQ